jgi:hypothetical protein
LADPWGYAVVCGDLSIDLFVEQFLWNNKNPLYKGLNNVFHSFLGVEQFPWNTERAKPN